MKIKYLKPYPIALIVIIVCVIGAFSLAQSVFLKREYAPAEYPEVWRNELVWINHVNNSVAGIFQGISYYVAAPKSTLPIEIEDRIQQPLELRHYHSEPGTSVDYDNSTGAFKITITSMDSNNTWIHLYFDNIVEQKFDREPWITIDPDIIRPGDETDVRVTVGSFSMADVEHLRRIDVGAFMTVNALSYSHLDSSPVAIVDKQYQGASWVINEPSREIEEHRTLYHIKVKDQIDGPVLIRGYVLLNYSKPFICSGDPEFNRTGINFKDKGSIYQHQFEFFVRESS